MRVEQHNGRYILCGAILPTEFIKHGQLWMSSGNLIVRVTYVKNGEWVYYSWEEQGEVRQYSKDSFAFQCRYCLVLDGPEIPADIQAAYKKDHYAPSRPGPGLGHQST